MLFVELKDFTLICQVRKIIPIFFTGNRCFYGRSKPLPYGEVKSEK